MVSEGGSDEVDCARTTKNMHACNCALDSPHKLDLERHIVNRGHTRLVETGTYLAPVDSVLCYGAKALRMKQGRRLCI